MTPLALLAALAVAPPPPAAEDAAGPEARGVPAADLRYDGETFGHWLGVLNTDLAPDRRARALDAVAAFGERGRSAEAARAVIAFARGFGWAKDAGGDTDYGRQQRAAILAYQRVFSPAAADLLAAELRSGEVGRQLFAIRVIDSRYWGIDEEWATAAFDEHVSAVGPALLDAAKSAGEADEHYVRGTALRRLVTRAPDTPGLADDLWERTDPARGGGKTFAAVLLAEVDPGRDGFPERYAELATRYPTGKWTLPRGAAAGRGKVATLTAFARYCDRRGRADDLLPPVLVAVAEENPKGAAALLGDLPDDDRPALARATGRAFVIALKKGGETGDYAAADRLADALRRAGRAARPAAAVLGAFLAEAAAGRAEENPAAALAALTPGGPPDDGPLGRAVRAAERLGFVPHEEFLGALEDAAVGPLRELTRREVADLPPDVRRAVLERLAADPPADGTDAEDAPRPAGARPFGPPGGGFGGGLRGNGLRGNGFGGNGFGGNGFGGNGFGGGFDDGDDAEETPGRRAVRDFTRYVGPARAAAALRAAARGLLDADAETDAR